MPVQLRQSVRVGKRMDRWAERLQERAEEANRIHAEDPNWEKRNAATPGPAWAWGFGSLPIIGWVCEVAIAIDAWRKRKRTST
jgi:hypothetical protein